MAAIKVRKNWTKKIVAICQGITKVENFQFYPGTENFEQKPIDLAEGELLTLVTECLTEGKGYLLYDKELRLAGLWADSYIGEDNVVVGGRRIEWMANEFNW